MVGEKEMLLKTPFSDYYSLDKQVALVLIQMLSLALLY